MAGNFPVGQRPRAACPSTHVSLLNNLRTADCGDSWRRFVDLYSPLVFGYCRRWGLQEADSRDVTQNVFLAVSRAMRSFVYCRQRGQFRSWIGTITCREIRAHVTRSQRLARCSVESATRLSSCDRELESEWESQSAAYLFTEAMRTVRPTIAADVWRAFEMTWIDEQPPSEVARRMEKPTQWIYKAKFRVLSRLREEVETLAEDIPRRPGYLGVNRPR